MEGKRQYELYIDAYNARGDEQWAREFYRDYLRVLTTMGFMIERDIDEVNSRGVINRRTVFESITPSHEDEQMLMRLGDAFYEHSKKMVLFN